MNAPDKLHSENAQAIEDGGSLEAIELELALKFQDFVADGFEGSVRRAVESVGGRLLFQMRLDGAEDCQRVAAVSVGADEERKFALVVMPADGSAPRVEAIETSKNPLARITPAYAGLMDQLGAAA